MTVPVIVDTDPGVDDAVALLLAAASPEVELLAVTTVFGNVDLAATTANALRLRTLAGYDGVPVAAGASRPLVHPQAQRAERVHAADGLGGRAAELPEPDGAVDPRGAVPLMAELVTAAAGPVTLVAIGPLTNIALLLAARPEVKPQIARIVAMGGALSGGNSTGAAEFNVFSDPEAARRVLVEEDVALTLVPLDLTMRCLVGSAWLDELAAGGARGTALARLLEHYKGRYRDTYGHDAAALHDPVALLHAAVPGTLHTTPLPLEVVCDHGPARGAVLADRRPNPAPAGRRVDVALDADIDALRGEMLARLHSLD